MEIEFAEIVQDSPDEPLHLNIWVGLHLTLAPNAAKNIVAHVVVALSVTSAGNRAGKANRWQATLHNEIERRTK